MDLLLVSFIQACLLWVAISAIIVLQDRKDITEHFAFVRIAGSFVGSVVPGIILSFLPANFYTIFLIVFLTVFICNILNFNEGMRLAALTASVIIAVSLTDPKVAFYMNSASRFVESCCGSFLAILIRYLTHYSIQYLKK